MRARPLHRILGAVLALLLAAPAARAQAPYPNRPVKLVVAYAAGNVADVLARLVAQKLSEQLGQPVVVENRPGQGGSLGAQIVAKAPPDGYTVLFSAMAAIAINPHVYSRVGYDPIADFAPIASLAQTRSGLLYANLELKANTLPELLALSKAHPGTLNYGTAGSGTVPHLNTEQLKGLTGLDATHVPYKAAAAVMTDVIGGRIQFAQESAAVVLPQVRAGKVKALAATGPDRLRELPDLPAITEIVPGFDPVRPWMGLLAPAGTAPEALRRLADAAAAVLAQPDTRERIAAADLVVLGLGPEAFAGAIRRDLERFGTVVRQLKLQAD